MTREQAKELLPVITAWADGKDVEYKEDGVWIKTITNFNLDNIEHPENYRIVTEREYRPFTKDEFILCCKDKWFTDKNTGNLYKCHIITDEYVKFQEEAITFVSLFENFTFTNGDPCGMRVRK